MEPIRKMKVFYIGVAILLLLAGSALWDAPSARADGEEPFIAQIQEIGKDYLVVVITDRLQSLREPGRRLSLIITEHTVYKNAAYKTVKKDFFSPGTLVKVKPVTKSNGEVVASMIRLVRR